MVCCFARQFGGQTTIDSKGREGLEICILLPRYDMPIGDNKGSEPALDGRIAGAGKTVLVVDDEALVRMLIADVLDELGFKILQGATAAEGLRILQSDAPIDLLVSDVGLPGGMNGRQMADTARIVRPDLKVLFITGYAEASVIGEGVLEPNMRVISKPFDLAAMTRLIRDLIEARS